MAELLWITENYPPGRGGMANSCDRIVDGLRKKGFHVHIIHFTNRNEPFKTDLQVNGTYTSIPVHENEAHTANLCWNSINHMGIPFTGIVCFGGYLPMITGPVFSKWLDLPLVTLLRGNDFDTAVFNPRRKPLLDTAIMQSRWVGCVAGDQLRKIKKLYPGINALFTPNGINTVDWQILPSEEKFSDSWRSTNLMGETCIGIFGKFKEKKGLEVLLQCLCKPGNTRDYFLLMAGEFEESISSLLDESGIRHELLQFLDRNELVKYYASCDLVVIPSHYEGMPNVLLEAGALGIPVIASSVGGMKDILSVFDEQYLFYPGDAQHLNTLLYKFRSMNPREQKISGEKLRDHIMNNYNSELELKPYIEIFSDEKFN